MEQVKGAGCLNQTDERLCMQRGALMMHIPDAARFDSDLRHNFGSIGMYGCPSVEYGKNGRDGYPNGVESHGFSGASSVERH